jgi:sugar lactone lactonase YvrE
MALMTTMLYPITSVSAKTLQFQHLISIYSDGGNSGQKQPEGIACNDGATLIVADTGNGRLLKYTFENRELKSEVVEIKLPQLFYPIKTKINSKAEIFVLDGKQRRILQLTSEGAFRSFLEPQGLPDPSEYVPRSFDIDANDNIYILDILSERILVLNPAGDYLKHIAFPKEYGFFSDLAIDAKGNVFLVDSINAMAFSAPKNALLFSPLTGPLKEYMRYPTSLATDGSGRIYLTDRNGGSVIILGQDGSYLSRLSAMGWKEGFLNYPSQICLNTRGEIFIADTLNNRIQIFTTIE